jgi:RNA polymerase sigma factor (sigma-70 family)
MSARSGVRIAKNSFTRTLDAFEEHRIKQWHWSVPGLTVPNWRAVRETGKFSQLIGGKYECLDCGMRHLLPGKGRALICKYLPAQEAKKRAVGYIELKLARARGQHDKIEDLMLSDLAYEIGRWRSRYSWGPDVVGGYLDHERLGEHFKRDDSLPDDGHNRKLTEDEGRLVYNHLPLVRKYAKRRSSIVFDEKGFYTTDDSLYSDLEEIGMRALEDVVRRYDPTRGVTLGAFARLRVGGAMDNYLQRDRMPTVGGLAEVHIGMNVPNPLLKKTSAAVKRYRDSTGGYKERSYASTSVRPDGKTRLIPANASRFNHTMDAALARLNHRQREVYRGRVLSDPPVTRSVLAAKLGIRDERQIPRIEKQAVKRIAKFLKVSPP